MPRSEDSEDIPGVPISKQSLGEAAALFRYLWPYRWQFALGNLSLLIGVCIGLLFPVLAGGLVDAVILQLREGIPKAWLQNANGIAVALLVILAFQALFAFIRTVLFTSVGERTLADLRCDTFARLVRLPMAFHHSRRVGELASRIASDLTRIRDTLVTTVPNSLRQAVQLVGGVILILSTSLKLTAVMLLSVPVLVVVAVYFGERIRRMVKQAQDRLADSHVIIEESLQNIGSVKAFTNETFEQQRYGRALDAYLIPALRVAVYEGAFISFIVFAVIGSLVVVLWYGAQLVLAGELTPGDLTRFMLLTAYVAGSVGSFAELYSELQRLLGASTRVREILRETPETLSEDTAALPRPRGAVRFEQVHFRYPSRPETPVLQGVSLAVEPGQRVALVGPSGAGKSTTIALLLRFFDPEAGQILLDGRDLRSYPLYALRSQMAMVPQDVLLFGGTITENIAYGRPGASQEEIEQAARDANAHEFICAFPDGYQTRVGERGIQLSGGQRQRIAIARAILRDPAILLLDEATSSLDAASERQVLEALEHLMRGRTALIIAHRLSTVRGADRIFVLEAGRVIESGTHAELMERQGSLYRDLSRLQLEPEPLADLSYPSPAHHQQLLPDS